MKTNDVVTRITRFVYTIIIVLNACSIEETFFEDMEVSSFGRVPSLPWKSPPPNGEFPE